MKRFLRKVNRGVVLFLALVIGFVVFVVVQTVSFKAEKTQITKICDDFCKATCEVYITPEELQNHTGDLTADEEKLLNDKLDKYFELWENVKPPLLYDYYSDMSEMRTGLKNAVYTNAKINGCVNDAICNMDLQNISIRRVSNEYALATFSCEYTVTYTNYVKIDISGNGYNFELFYPSELTEYYAEYSGENYYYQTETDKQLSESEFIKQTENIEKVTTKGHFSTDSTVMLKKTNGKWSIAYASSYMSYCDMW